MTKIKDLHRRWSRDDDYKAAYDGLDEEFRLARALIKARTAAGTDTRGSLPAFVWSRDPGRELDRAGADSC